MQGKWLDLKERAKIRERFREGAKAATLAEEYGLHLATIYRILKEGNKKKKKKGPWKIITGRMRQKLLQEFRENPTISATKAASSVGLSASDRTIRRELRKAAFTYIRMRKTQVLTKKHKEARLEFAQKHVTWSQQQWDCVVFTDEKKWNLNGNDGYVSIWKDDKHDIKMDQVTNRVGGFMVWGAISAFGGIVLICPEGTITAESYVQMLEEDFFGEYKEALPDNFIFMHDNAPPHRARSTAEYLENREIEVLEWPALSPDLNPIENLWGILSRKVYEGGKTYQNSTELWEALVRAWNETPLSFFRNLYDSMSKRMISVIEKKGDRIKY